MTTTQPEIDNLVERARAAQKLYESAGTQERYGRRHQVNNGSVTPWVCNQQVHGANEGSADGTYDMELAQQVARHD